VDELGQVGAPYRLVVELGSEVRQFGPVRGRHQRRATAGRRNREGHGRQPGDVERGHGGRREAGPGGGQAVSEQHHCRALAEGVSHLLAAAAVSHQPVEGIDRDAPLSHPHGRNVEGAEDRLQGQRADAARHHVLRMDMHHRRHVRTPPQHREMDGQFLGEHMVPKILGRGTVQVDEHHVIAGAEQQPAIGRPAGAHQQEFLVHPQADMTEDVRDQALDGEHPAGARYLRSPIEIRVHDLSSADNNPGRSAVRVSALQKHGSAIPEDGWRCRNYRQMRIRAGSAPVDAHRERAGRPICPQGSTPCTPRCTCHRMQGVLRCGRRFC
jgi:hypothetical protein